MSTLDSSTRTLMGSALPPPPRSPSPSAKDLIFSYRGAQGIVLAVGLGFAGLGSLFTLVFCWGLPMDVMLGVSGVAAQATVVDTHLNESVEINGENPTTVQFEYQVDGQRYQDQTDTLDDALRSVDPGAAVPIEYLPSDPAVARLKGETRSTFGYLGVFVLIFPLVGLAMTAAVVRANRREIRAYRYGEPVAARVVSFEEDRSTAVNDKHPWKLAWEFTHDGQTYRGELSSMRQHELQPYAEAKDVTVLMLPDDPSVNTLFIP